MTSKLSSTTHLSLHLMAYIQQRTPDWPRSLHTDGSKDILGVSDSHSLGGTNRGVSRAKRAPPGSIGPKVRHGKVCLARDPRLQITERNHSFSYTGSFSLIQSFLDFHNLYYFYLSYIGFFFRIRNFYLTYSFFSFSALHLSFSFPNVFLFLLSFMSYFCFSSFSCSFLLVPVLYPY